jgi:hypothetical protein
VLTVTVVIAGGCEKNGMPEEEHRGIKMARIMDGCLILSGEDHTHAYAAGVWREYYSTDETTP